MIENRLTRIWVILFFVISLTANQKIYAQHTQKYFPPDDSLVKQKLAWWSDIKFGLLMHWGTYSQWGIVESWSLCPEDEDWCKRRGPYSNDYFKYREGYEGLQKTFNPTKFDPELWAKAAKDAGMRYVVFTTKHHDGFCMFDTKETNYKITSPDCPYSASPKANVTKEIFDAFRKEGLGVGAYFSKPDWHCSDYWDPYFPPVDRNPNYDLKRYPEKWERYKTFTNNQIQELMSNYGKVDILWLDGGWVQPMTATSPRWGTHPVDQDIDMKKIVTNARKLQPGLIVVDRAVEGLFQNYLTPEQSLPDSILPYPWETCMTMATSWSYVEKDAYKSTNELIHLLCTIVSRGGNFLLNVAPGPDGQLVPDAYVRMKEIGEWMKINNSAIYETTPVVNSSVKNIVFTQGKKKELYAIYLATKEEQKIPAEIILKSVKVKSKVSLLGSNQKIKWKQEGNSIKILIPEALQSQPPCKHAWVFVIS
ncbi:MAG: alpha-L-fucosidase [Bacteroidota bacterium]